MSSTTPAPTPLQGERKGIGDAFVYTELIVHFSPSVCSHLNGIAAATDGLEPGDWVDYQPGDHQVIALPLQPLPLDEGRARYARLRVRVDDQEFQLNEFPRFFSSPPDRPELFRNGPTWIPVDRFADDFFGRYHDVSVLEGGERVFGPARRFFASRTSGVVYSRFDDGEGKLVATLSHVDPVAMTGHGLNPAPLLTIWTDPAFGDPLGGRQLDSQGTADLSYKIIGRDWIGSTPIFNEGVLLGARPSSGPVRVEVDFPKRGSGLANVMWGGYTEAGAFRADARVV
jgi:hypothetical protein